FSNGQIPLNGIIAYYPFDGNILDSSGNNLHGNLVGSQLLSANDRHGVPNACYYFDGTNYVSVTDTSQLNFDSHEGFSVSFWMRTNVSGSLIYGLIGKHVPDGLSLSDRKGWIMVLYNDYLRT